MSGRDGFFDNIRRSLGRTAGPDPSAAGEADALGLGTGSVDEDARAALDGAQAAAEELLAALAESARAAGWRVARVGSPAEAGEYVASVARELEARSLVHSTHEAVRRLGLPERLAGAGVDTTAVELDASDEDTQRRRLRKRSIDADVGVTGVDFAIAETGSCVLIARPGVSRLVSLLPPVHVAVVERGQVLPGLDELFAVRRLAHLTGEGEGYMSVITGPSRSADIEQTLITGVHGPGEVHMVLVG